jgi:DNA-binding LacI/PurR family transcriptional regulator
MRFRVTIDLRRCQGCRRRGVHGVEGTRRAAAVLIRPRLTTIAASLSIFASAAVSRLLKASITSTRRAVSLVVPARLVIGESTGPVQWRRS